MEKTTEIFEVKDKLASLCADYEEKAETYAQSEAQTRISLINPFWEALGWNLRDPLQIRVEDPRKGKGLDAKGTKYADYCFYINRREVLVVEAKRPKVDLHNRTAINQLKRYGFNRNIDVGILHDFEEFRPFDTGFAPTELAEANRIKEFDIGYQQYPEYAEKLLNTFGREAVLDGSLEKLVHRDRKKKKAEPIDKIFLEHLKEWRSEIAISIYRNNTELTSHELNESVGRLLNRLLFLRIMEEREIIIEMPLRNIWHDIYESQKAGERGEHYTELCKLFRRMNKLYNGDLFKEDIVDEILVPNSPLYTALKDLYDKSLPYDYSIMPIEMLGTVYERFLGEVIVVDEKKQAQVEQKPEVRKAGGVYYTPKYIVDYIVEQTVGKLIKGKTPDEIRTIRILDPACGSGSFLIGAFERLTDYYLNWYRKRPKKNIKHAYQDNETGQWKLAFHVKKQILFNNIFGVDIDERAVEGTKFSLYLKLMEDESFDTIRGRELLPGLADNIKCGNSLIGTDILDMDILPPVGTKERTDELERIRPFDWENEFPRVFVNKSSDAFGATSLDKGGKPSVVSLNKESKPSDAFGATSLDKGGKPSVVALNKGDVERSETEGSSAPTAPSPALTESSPGLTTSSHTTTVPSPAPTSSEHPLPKGEGQLPSPSGRRTEDEGFISGGFDAVIGNPPWVQSKFIERTRKDYYSRKYRTAIKQYDKFNLFVEKSVNNLKEAGLFGYIIPSRFVMNPDYETFREFLVNNVSISCIVDVGEHIFEGVEMPSLLFFFENVISTQNNIETIVEIEDFHSQIWKSYNIPQRRFKKEKSYLFTIYESEEIKNLTTKMVDKSITFSEIVDNARGVEIGKKHDCISLVKRKGFKPFLAGEDIGRYYITGLRWIDPTFDDVNYKDENIYKGPKILIRKTGTGIKATLDLQDNWVIQVIYVFKKRIEKYDYLYLLGLLNSKLMSEYYFAKFGEKEKQAFPHLRQTCVKQLPIRTIDFSNPDDVKKHNLMVQMVEDMLALHKQLHKEKSKSRKKIIQDDIDHLDKKIDALVYELYGLTEEEIGVVEGK